MITVSGGEDRRINYKALTHMYQWAGIIGTMETWLICWYLQLYHAECLWQGYCVERKCGCRVSTKTMHQAYRPVKYTFLSISEPFILKHLPSSDCSWIVISFHILLRPVICEFLKSCLSGAPQKEHAVLTWSELTQMPRLCWRHLYPWRNITADGQSLSLEICIYRKRKRKQEGNSCCSRVH